MNGPRLYWLDPNVPDGAFPDPALALDEPNGLLAVGGDLSATRLINAYDIGVFPWYNPDETILWWSPDPRTVFHVNDVHVSRRLRRTINKGDYAVTLDLAFEQVIRTCAALREDAEGTWLGPEMRAAYTELHHQGHAHAIEVWKDKELVGGLYGVARGNVFFGESMFSTVPDASKIALVWLARQLAAWGYELLDGQVGSPHLYRMGAIDMPRAEFLATVRRGQTSRDSKGYWAFDIDAPQHARHIADPLN
ncbi:leucyl/phenylalanyl-tRNA--protein transferase [Salinisphaera japonica]|uniref:Leucyl/phenylalanyl-tRNA--protein transferase n=1 Tax=Salinisphaera japonica YTM-1 TaxID=1209778 RepID=A0A423PKN3_9GAMM|nr:leucyl/phenylalanyl-tRNA--protein transferase [Salinisphaera japonica]ROO26133.1 leucyl/phenylalanyl-tRNA--protein transferase [Salinisphaera japonica YTM-1]